MNKNLTAKIESQEELIKKAILLLPPTLVAAQKFEQSFCEGKNYPGVDRATVYLEAIFFLLHLIDRKIFGLVGPEGREIVMNKLFMEIKEDSLARVESAKRQEMEGIMTSTYYLRQREYANYVWRKEDDTGPKGELLWEFGKIMANMLDKPKDGLIITKALITMSLTLKYSFPDVEEYFNDSKDG